MGCDIHMHTEKKVDGEWIDINFYPFDDRCYNIFGFLADVRNYSDVKPISQPRGVPEDSPAYKKEFFDYYYDFHSGSWLSVEELSNYDYDQIMEDKRVTRKTDYGWSVVNLFIPKNEYYFYIEEIRYDSIEGKTHTNIEIDKRKLIELRDLLNSIDFLNLKASSVVLKSLKPVGILK